MSEFWWCYRSDRVCKTRVEAVMASAREEQALLESIGSLERAVLRSKAMFGTSADWVTVQRLRDAREWSAWIHTVARVWGSKSGS